MLGRYGVAGPGPETLAYRLRRAAQKAAGSPIHAHRASHTTTRPSPQPAQASLAYEAGQARRKPLHRSQSGRDQQGSGQQSETPRVRHGASNRDRLPPESKPTVALPPPPPDILDYVPMMFAPPKHSFSQATYDKLIQALSSGDTLAVAERFADLHPDVYADKFTMGQWEAISALLAKQPWTKPGNFRAIHNLSAQRPALYGSLTTMAIEAALRDQYQGLYRLFLALLAAGKPQLIISTYERYRDRLMDFQGKNKADLHSFDRAKRMAARADSPGIKPLSTVYLAALTMTNQLQAEQMLSVFGTRCDWRKLDRSNEADVVDALRRGNHSEAEIEKFEEGTARFLFAVLCHHPQTLAERMMSTYRRGDVTHFDWLYNSILAGSIGPNRFLIPSETLLLSHLPNVHGILLPIEIWEHIIIGLERLKRPLDILQVIEENLPERGIDPPPTVIATALHSFAKLIVAQGIAEEAKVASQHAMARVLSLVESRGLGNTDHITAAVIETSCLFRDYKNIADQFQRFKKTPRNIGPLTRAAMIHALLVVNKNDLAREVLEWTQMGDMSFVQPLSLKPYHQYAIDVMRQRRPAREMLKEIDKVIIDGKTPFGRELSHRFAATLLALRLDVGGAAVADTVAERLIALARLGGGAHYHGRWTGAIERFLNRGGTLHAVKYLEAQVGLRVLEGFIQHADHVSDVRANRLWDTYLRPITRTSRLNQDQRRMFQQQAIDLFRKGNPEGLRPHTLFTLVEGSLARRLQYVKPNVVSAANTMRANETDVQDALHWWEYLQRVSDPSANSDALGSTGNGSKVPGYFWSKAMFAFKRAGREDVAVDLVADAWNGRKVGLAHHFWDEADQAGLLAKAGISSELLEDARMGSWALSADDVRWERDPVEEEETLDEHEEALLARRTMTAEDED